MANAGFFEQKSVSPTRFALVVGAHAAVLGAVMFAAGPQITRHWDPPIIIDSIPIPQPPPDPAEPPRHDPQPVPPTLTNPPPIVDIPVQPPIGVQVADNRPLPPLVPVIADPPPRPDPPAQVRRGAEIDPRFASALQPQYPLSEQRAGRTGTVVIRVTIGPDGRVRAAERVSATSDAFWAAAERQALTRWRFRPATVDDRPVESSRVMTIHFRIEDI